MLSQTTVKFRLFHTMSTLKGKVPDGIIHDGIGRLWSCKYCATRNYCSEFPTWNHPGKKWHYHGNNCRYYLHNGALSKRKQSSQKTAAPHVSSCSLESTAKKRPKTRVPKKKQLYVYEEIDGLQVAGICDEEEKLKFGMVQQHPSKKGKLMCQEGKVIRPAAAIFAPFGKNAYAVGYDSRNGKSLYVTGKALAKAKKAAEMAIANAISPSPSVTTAPYHSVTTAPYPSVTTAPSPSVTTAPSPSVAAPMKQFLQDKIAAKNALYLFEQHLEKKEFYNESGGINVLSLLDGAGASVEIVKRLNLDVNKIFAVEKSKLSREVAQKNHGEKLIHVAVDIMTFNYTEVKALIEAHGPVPLVLGCWPCDLQSGANAKCQKLVAEANRNGNTYNPRFCDPIRAQVFRVCSFVKTCMLELHPELPTPFVLLENVRHNESEIDEVKERLSDFCVSAFCTDAIWVSGVPRHRVFFSNIKPTRNSDEEKMCPRSLELAKHAVRLEWQDLYDNNGLDEENRQYGRKLGPIEFPELKQRQLHTPRKSVGGKDNFWRHAQMKKGTSWPLGLMPKELLMGYRKGYFSSLVPDIITTEQGHQLLGDAWNVPQVVERLRSLKDIFPEVRKDTRQDLQPYFWEQT